MLCVWLAYEWSEFEDAMSISFDQNLFTSYFLAVSKQFIQPLYKNPLDIIIHACYNITEWNRLCWKSVARKCCFVYVSFRRLTLKQLNSLTTIELFVQEYYYMLITEWFVTGPVICPRVVVLAGGRRPRANTTARGQITGPVTNHSVIDNFIKYLFIITPFLQIIFIKKTLK